MNGKPGSRLGFAAAGARLRRLYAAHPAGVALALSAAFVPAAGLLVALRLRAGAGRAGCMATGLVQEAERVRAAEAREKHDRELLWELFNQRFGQAVARLCAGDEAGAEKIARAFIKQARAEDHYVLASAMADCWALAKLRHYAARGETERAQSLYLDAVYEWMENLDWGIDDEENIRDANATMQAHNMAVRDADFIGRWLDCRSNLVKLPAGDQSDKAWAAFEAFVKEVDAASTAGRDGRAAELIISMSIARLGARRLLEAGRREEAAAIITHAKGILTALEMRAGTIRTPGQRLVGHDGRVALGARMEAYWQHLLKERERAGAVKASSPE